MTAIHAPNALSIQDQKARNKIRFEAFGIIHATPEKRISNRALAKALGMDPRGLRQVLERDDHFMIELRGEDYRTEPWYRINPNHAPLKLTRTAPPKIIRTLAAGALPANLTMDEP